MHEPAARRVRGRVHEPLVVRVGAQDRVRAHAGLGQMVEVAADPVHGAGAQGLDAGGLQRLEDGCRFGIGWGGQAVDPGVMVSQAKSGSVGSTARFRDQFRLERGPGRRDARGLAGRRARFGGKGNVELPVVGDRP